MFVYRIYDKSRNKWMKAGGEWADKEEQGKVWKQLNHVSLAVNNAFPKPYHWQQGLGYKEIHEHRKYVENLEIIKYEIKEVERIKVEI